MCLPRGRFTKEISSSHYSFTRIFYPLSRSAEDHQTLQFGFECFGAEVDGVGSDLQCAHRTFEPAVSITLQCFHLS